MLEITDSLLDQIKKRCFAGKTMTWKSGKLLGEGRFGKVFLYKNQVTGEDRAVKLVIIDPAKQNILREVKVLEKADHIRIVKYFEHHLDGNTLYIHMEYISGGSLNQMLKRRPLSETKAKTMFAQVVEGVAYLHSVPIFHRDLKSQNILLTENGEVKLCDFGTSKILSDATVDFSQKTEVVGTFKFMAPEMFGKKKKKTIAADIWSTGCVLVEMLTQHPPWTDINNQMDLVSEMCDTTFPTYKLPENTSPEVGNMLSDCFKYDPTERPHAVALLSYPFLAQN